MSFAKSDSPSAQDVLVRERRLARPPTSRRHGHLDLTHRTHLHHQTRQRPAVPDTVPTDRRPVATRTRPCRRARRSRRDDAAASTHPSRKPRPSHRRRTPTQRRPGRRTQQTPAVLTLSCRPTGGTAHRPHGIRTRAAHRRPGIDAAAASAHPRGWRPCNAATDAQCSAGRPRRR